MTFSPYLNQKIQNIYVLISDKQIKKAYNLCLDLMKKFPQNEELTDLKAEIEDQIVRQNEGQIEAKYQEIKKLWAQNNYGEIIIQLKTLLLASPNNQKILNDIRKAQEKYAEKMQHDIENYTKSQKAKLDKLYQENINLLIDELMILEQSTAGNKKMADMIRGYREKIIHKKIVEKEDLLKSDKYDVIENYLITVKKIQPDNEELKNLFGELNKKKGEKQLDEKAEFVYSGKQNLNTLMHLKKYDKAIKVAKELLVINKNDSGTIKTLHQARKKYFAQTRDEIIKKMISNNDCIKKDYIINRNNYIRI